MGPAITTSSSLRAPVPHPPTTVLDAERVDETRVAKDKKKKKEVPLPLKKMYQCDVCNYTNSNKAHLNLHKRNVHRVENKTFICESCPDTFTTWGGLQCHINWKHKFDQKYECNLCPYKAVYRGHLQAHIKKLHKQI